MENKYRCTANAHASFWLVGTNSARAAATGLPGFLTGHKAGTTLYLVGVPYGDRKVLVRAANDVCKVSKSCTDVCRLDVKSCYAACK